MMLSRFPMGGGGAELKKANGTKSASSGTLSVTGLDFKPIAFGYIHSNNHVGFALFDADGNKITAYSNQNSSTIVEALTASVTDGGFSCSAAQMYSMSHSWWAIGY